MCISDISAKDAGVLHRLGLECKTTSGVGPDSLPYTSELDQVQSEFAIATGQYVVKAEIARRLLAWRKNPASRPA
jgi:hypothetical protein